MVDLVNELQGKVAVITGSARNIGRATAEELARAGAALVINAVQAKDLCEEVAAGIRARGGRAIPFVADVRDADAVKAMAAAAAKEFGGIDIVVHNAAVRSNTPLEEMDFDTFRKSVEISIHGCFHLAKNMIPYMKNRGGGSFIGVGGLNSTRGAPGRAHTMAAKAGLAAFIRGLAYDFAPYGIRANQVVVGTYDTSRANNPSAAAQPLLRALPDIPLGRKGVPQDMANLIRFLVGPGGDYISGQTIHSNGGALMNM